MTRSRNRPRTCAPEIAKVAAILQQELPVIPVVWYQHTVSVDKKLTGVVIDPLQRSYGLNTMSWSD